MFKLCGFSHFLRNPVLKIFLDVKSDLKQTLKIILKQYREQDQIEYDEKLYELADRLSDYFPVCTDSDTKKSNVSKVLALKDRLDKHFFQMKSLKNQLKTLLEQKCIHEAGSNIISQALTNKTVSRNEIQEMKEYDSKNQMGVINNETFYYSLK